MSLLRSLFKKRRSVWYILRPGRPGFAYEEEGPFEKTEIAESYYEGGLNGGVLIWTDSKVHINPKKPDSSTLVRLDKWFRFTDLSEDAKDIILQSIEEDEPELPEEPELADEPKLPEEPELLERFESKEEELTVQFPGGDVLEAEKAPDPETTATPEDDTLVSDIPEAEITASSQDDSATAILNTDSPDTESDSKTEQVVAPTTIPPPPPALLPVRKTPDVNVQSKPVPNAPPPPPSLLNNLQRKGPPPPPPPPTTSASGLVSPTLPSQAPPPPLTANVNPTSKPHVTPPPPPPPPPRPVHANGTAPLPPRPTPVHSIGSVPPPPPIQSVPESPDIAEVYETKNLPTNSTPPPPPPAPPRLVKANINKTASPPPPPTPIFK